MIGDECKTYKVGKYTVQENCIVRDENMRIVGRLEELKLNREALAERDALLREASAMLRIACANLNIHTVNQALAIDANNTAAKINEFMGERDETI